MICPIGMEKDGHGAENQKVSPWRNTTNLDNNELIYHSRRSPAVPRHHGEIFFI